MYFPSTGRAGWSCQELLQRYCNTRELRREFITEKYRKKPWRARTFCWFGPAWTSLARSPSARPFPLPDTRSEGAGLGLDRTRTALPGRPSNGAAPKLNVLHSKQTRAFHLFFFPPISGGSFLPWPAKPPAPPPRSPAPPARPGLLTGRRAALRGCDRLAAAAAVPPPALLRE